MEQNRRDNKGRELKKVIEQKKRREQKRRE